MTKQCFWQRIQKHVGGALCIASSFLVTARQFFGSPVVCDAGAASDGIRPEVLDGYCWMYATFKIPIEYKGPCASSEQEMLEGIIYNSYYQWVPIYLFLLSALFYLPRCLWLIMEGGLMKFFGKGTTTRVIEDPEEKRDKLVEFFRANIHNKYNIYYFGFMFCELLNVFVVLLAFWLTDKFLNHRFLAYGFKVYAFYRLPPEEQSIGPFINPMCYTFPRISSCNYYRYGTGGKQESINAICILALNIINDKVFLVIWWWFVFLLGVGVTRIFFRSIQVNSARLRFYLMKIRMSRFFKRNEDMDKIRSYICNCSRGDWFVLYQLSKNLNRPFFMDFLSKLTRMMEMEKKNPNCKGLDEGDGFFDMMLQPNLRAYTSDDKDDKDDDDDEEEEDKD
ncbi:innexin inx2-like isoform X3 [Tigriopus californicus]|uniref:innexin inx2-like isoform X3 n=1 Tax=Tigriopus californicus TaxID=6832 RepID=UPI0027D9DAF1|nr:innexin inx2-like isoform X3 [Tigriopus californicus]XP_059095584.1 innexin inx2-like isoform X3 [Tigriopus californicus]